MRHARFVAVGLLSLTALIAGAKMVSGTTDGTPDSMASLGDSITRAANPELFLLGDQPQYSWSTGSNSTVQSHYFRILQANSVISGKNFNYAVSGAKMTDLNSQAVNVNNTPGGVEYVTILMGGNDVCTSSESTMTPVATFRAQFQTAMETLNTGSPNARIFLASIPDVFLLWEILHTNPSAVLTWNAFNVCQSMLANPTSTAQADVDRRDRVRQRNIDFNTQLAETCALYSQCRFDNNAVFNHPFVPGDVSTLDYFHPSIQGQANLASGTWAVSDPDRDTWASGAEAVIGTDPLDGCADNPTHDALPVDFNNDTFVTSADLSSVASVIGQAVPPAPARADIAPDPPDQAITSGDLSQVAARIGQSCAP